MMTLWSWRLYNAADVRRYLSEQPAAANRARLAAMAMGTAGGGGGRQRRRRFAAIDDDPRFRCCAGCCHVRTGTVALGAYNLVIQLFAACTLLAVLLRPELLERHGGETPADWRIMHMGGLWASDAAVVERTGDRAPGIGLSVPTVPSAELRQQRNAFELANPDEPLAPPDGAHVPPSAPMSIDDGQHTFEHFRHKAMRRLRQGDVQLLFALVLGLIFITCLLIYGALKHRPVYLLPFFCFQVFDFIVSCLTAVGHNQWLPPLRRAVHSAAGGAPAHDGGLSAAAAQWLALAMLFTGILVLIFKAYLIGVVWACHQYAHMRQAAVAAYAVDDWYSSDDSCPGTNDERAAGTMGRPRLLLPPDYETAAKMSHGAAAVAAGRGNDDMGPPPAYNSSASDVDARLP